MLFHDKADAATDQARRQLGDTRYEEIEVDAADFDNARFLAELTRIIERQLPRSELVIATLTRARRPLSPAVWRRRTGATGDVRRGPVEPEPESELSHGRSPVDISEAAV
jgi:hypothetical protein